MKLIIVYDENNKIIVGKEIARLTKQETNDCKMFGQAIKILNLETMQEEEHFYNWEEIDVLDLMTNNKKLLEENEKLKELLKKFNS